jgi:hypothetical protein
MWEFAFWNASAGPSKVIERRAVVLEVIPPARFTYEATIHQGRIERGMDTDLLRYSTRGVLRNTKLVSLQIDKRGNPEFPVVVKIEVDGVKHSLRIKHLVSADGSTLGSPDSENQLVCSWKASRSTISGGSWSW